MFKYIKKKHIADITYNRKTSGRAKLHQEKNSITKFKENKIIFTSKQYYPSFIREMIGIITRKNSCVTMYYHLICQNFDTNGSMA